MSAAIIVHGGTKLSERPAGEDQRDPYLEAAREAGSTVLDAGGPAIDAVQAAVRVLEQAPPGLFIAGRGSQAQLDGLVRYDASLMSSDRGPDGREGRAGAVIGVTGLACPIDGARAVYELPHTTLAGPAADRVLSGLGLERRDAPTPDFDAAALLAEYRRRGMGVLGKGTVGAAALDAAGTLAAATSTGGFDGALPGRSGDSGAIAAGTYACAEVAVSCTGDGDRILLSGLGAAVAALAGTGMDAGEAVDRGLDRLLRFGAAGGFIALAPDGRAFVRTGLYLRYAASGPVDFKRRPIKG